MNWFKDLTKLQKAILILIAGVVSVTGLFNLSNIHQDYYVTNAVTTALFQTILFLVLSSPFLYLVRRRKNKSTGVKKLEEAKKVVVEDEEKTRKALDKLEFINQSEDISSWNGIAIDKHLAGLIIYKMKHETPLNSKEETVLRSLKEKL